MRFPSLLASAALGLAIVPSVPAHADGATKLVVNGAAVNTQTKTIGGKTWVPLDDVAKALKMKAYPAKGQISLRPAGGAFQVANKLKGDQGEELFSGKYRFTVLNVSRAAKYDYRNRNRYTPSSPIEAAKGEELVIVDCRIKNGTPQRREFAFSTGDWGQNTALTDQNEQSYAPGEYDVAADETAPLGKWALPGSAVNFSIVFHVPAGTPLKDLIYSAVEYSERADKKGTDFRVALKP